MTQEQIILTNTPFQSTCENMLIEVPDGVTVDIQMSTDGKNYHSVDSPVTGPELIEMGPIVRGSRIVFKSIAKAKIKIKS